MTYYLSKDSRINFATCQLICIQTNIQARIKKIMQKDEEVGKVAQATPIVICTSVSSLFLSHASQQTNKTFLQPKRSNSSFN